MKEQLWALLEFMEEGDTDETEMIFCTTDVHKSFDDDCNLFKEKLMARASKISTPLGNISFAHDG